MMFDTNGVYALYCSVTSENQNHLHHKRVAIYLPWDVNLHPSVSHGPGDFSKLGIHR